MSHSPPFEPWEQIPFSFHFPFFMIWFVDPDGLIDGYMFDYYSFQPVYEQCFWLRIPFRQPFWVGCAPIDP